MVRNCFLSFEVQNDTFGEIKSCFEESQILVKTVKTINIFGGVHCSDMFRAGMWKVLRIGLQPIFVQDIMNTS